jgi:hypothetical protein
MKSKKIIAGILSVAILSTSAAAAFAANPQETKSYINKVSASQVQEHSFGAFTGIIKSISDSVGTEGTISVFVESESGEQASFRISKDTFLLSSGDIKVGSRITGYYDANAPMLMIYPPQYNAQVVVVERSDQIVKVDQFDKDLVSMDKFLKLNVDKDTEIVQQDGTSYTGALENKKLVVVYTTSSKSMPSQTTPKKIVVLNEKETSVMGDVSKMDILAGGSKMEGSKAYVNGHGAVMVPLRPIAEALGFEVTWDNTAQHVRVGKGISLSIGKDSYHYMKTAPITLGTAPEIKEGKTYVPLSFFREVAHMNNAYVFENQIVIDNEEKME